MTVAYNGSYEFRPAKAYFLKKEKERQARLAKWKEEDRIRLDAMFDHQQVSMNTGRDEDTIARILIDAEKRATNEYQNLLDSRLIYTTPADYLGTSDTLIKSKTRKKFGFEN